MLKYDNNLTNRLCPKLPEGAWLNNPGRREQLGHLTLINFWSSSCSICNRTLNHLKKWHRAYAAKGLKIVSIHSPQFEFEKNIKHLVFTLEDRRIYWPVLNDDQGVAMQEFENSYLPRQLLVNKNGIIVLDQIGEGNYEKIEQTIREELLAASAKDLPESVSKNHIHKMGNICYGSSTDIVLGKNEGHFKYDSENYMPGVLTKGGWQLEKEFLGKSSDTNSFTDYLSLNFSGVGVNMLAGSTDKPVKALIMLNNNPIPIGEQGKDIFMEGTRTFALIQNHKIYSLIKGGRHFDNADLKIYIDSKDFRAYSFSFDSCVFEQTQESPAKLHMFPKIQTPLSITHS